MYDRPLQGVTCLCKHRGWIILLRAALAMTPAAKLTDAEQQTYKNGKICGSLPVPHNEQAFQLRKPQKRPLAYRGRLGLITTAAEMHMRLGGPMLAAGRVR